MKEQVLTTVSKEYWDREYASIRAIPSSTRENPAKALVLFSELLNISGPKRVLDVGCGNGRNAVYLAKRGCQVTAVDFSEMALAETKHRSNQYSLEHRICVQKLDVTDALPFSASSFDLILDGYTFCHLLDTHVAAAFWREMGRVVTPTGYLLSIVFSNEDSYYAQFNRGSVVVCDPSNGISKRLYSEPEIKNFFSRLFEIFYFAKFEFDDVVHGGTYNRVVFVSILKRRPY